MKIPRYLTAPSSDFASIFRSLGGSYPAWSPQTFAGTNDAVTAMSMVLDQLRAQMQNTPRRTRRPIRPNTYWQFANGRIGVPETFLDLTEMKVYRAWDRSLGAFVTYAAQ